MDHEWLKSMPGLKFQPEILVQTQIQSQITVLSPNLKTDIKTGLRKEPNDLAEGVNITFLIIYCCLFLISIYKCALFLFKARYDLAVIIGANIIALIGKYLTSLFNFSFKINY